MCEHVIEIVLICVRIRSPRVPKSFRLLHLCEGGDYFGQCDAVVAMYHDQIPINHAEIEAEHHHSNILLDPCLYSYRVDLKDILH